MKQNTQTQTKIPDSKTWIFCLKHFTKQNCGIKKVSQTSPKIDQVQYVVAATFDQWLSIKIINSTKMHWLKFIEMKMAMPVINACIEFDEEFKPLYLVLAYFDGSIECCPWDKIENFYSAQIEGAKKRQLTKSYPQVLKQSKRTVFVNKIQDESEHIQETFMLETICFLHKQGNYLYAINLKGELKIFQIHQGSPDIQILQKIRFNMKVSHAQYIPKLNQNDHLTPSSLVAICFEKISTPIILEISPKTTFEQIKLKVQKIYFQISKSQKQPQSTVKYLSFDPKSQRVVTCTQKNEISIFSIEKEDFMQKDFILSLQLEKTFHLESTKSTVENVNDLSIKDNRLLILCNQSFFIYDLNEGIILNEGQKLKQTLDMGKMVSGMSSKGKPVLLIKKKFNYLDSKQRSSTTLHLFTGK